MKHLETDAAEGLRAEQEIPAPPPRKPPPLRNSTIAPWVLAPGTSLNHRILYDSCSILHLVSRALVFGTSVHRCRLCKKPFLLVVRRTSQSRRSGCRNLDADNTVKIQATDSVDHWAYFDLEMFVRILACRIIWPRLHDSKMWSRLRKKRCGSRCLAVLEHLMQHLVDSSHGGSRSIKESCMRLDGPKPCSPWRALHRGQRRWLHWIWRRDSSFRRADAEATRIWGTLAWIRQTAYDDTKNDCLTTNFPLLFSHFRSWRRLLLCSRFHAASLVLYPARTRLSIVCCIYDRVSCIYAIQKPGEIWNIQPTAILQAKLQNLSKSFFISLCSILCDIIRYGSYTHTYIYIYVIM